MRNEAFAVIAGIQHEVVEKLATFVSGHNAAPGNLASAEDGDLWQQLQAANVLPKGVDVSFLQEMTALAVPRLFSGAKNPFDIVRTVFDGQRKSLERLLCAENPKEAVGIARDIFEESATNLWKTVGPLLASQLSIVVSFATTAALLPAKAGPAIEDAVLRYFFTPEGFETVDGSRLVAPIHLGDVDLGSAGELKAVFSERTAERYVRDLIRLMVEAADDARYNDLRARHSALLELVGKEKRTKYKNWFKGFSSMAEAAVTSSVEEACLGVSSFQTSALIAASAGTFAGTAARKATQHVFLSELEFLRAK
jgi:hypothetical protein